jgi:hypothetical protein
MGISPQALFPEQNRTDNNKNWVWFLEALLAAKGPYLCRYSNFVIARIITVYLR